MKAYSEYTTIRIVSRPSPGCELPFSTSRAKVGRLGAEKSASDRQTDRHYVNLYILPVSLQPDGCKLFVMLTSSHLSF